MTRSQQIELAELISELWAQYSEEQAKFIVEEIKHVDFTRACYAMKRLSVVKKFKPTLPEIIEELNLKQETDKQDPPVMFDGSIHDCEVCIGSGAIKAYHVKDKIKQYPYCFRCWCSRGQKAKNSWPEFPEGNPDWMIDFPPKPKKRDRPRTPQERAQCLQDAMRLMAGAMARSEVQSNRLKYGQDTKPDHIDPQNTHEDNEKPPTRSEIDEECKGTTYEDYGF